MPYVYRKSFFNKHLKDYARAYLNVLPPEVTCLVSMGSSGCAIASAMIALATDRDLHNLYVKKQSEVSHSGIGGQFNHVGEVTAIVDDFIDTGDTVRALARVARERTQDVRYCLTVRSFMADEVCSKLNIASIIVEDKHLP